MRPAAAAVLAALAAGPARAAEPYRSLDLVIGHAIVLGDEQDVLANTTRLPFRQGPITPTIALAWLVRAGRLVSYGLEAGLMTGHKIQGTISERALGDVDQPPDGRRDSLSIRSNVKTSMLWATPLIRFGLSDLDAAQNLRPYVILGLGYYMVRTPPGVATLNGITSSGAVYTAPIPIHRSQTDNLGLNFGGGLALRLTGRIELGLDLRYHYVVSGRGFSGRDDLQYLIPALRVTFGF